MTAQRDRSWLRAWLHGTGVKFDSAEARGKRAYRLVLLGAPGVGKGTQAELICERLGTCHLSTGDVFRAAKNLKPAELSPALKAALEYMRRGDLVPDDTVLALVRERARCLHWPTGFLLDGFPRTVPQAEAFDEILKSEKLKLDAVLSYEMPIDQIVARLGGRRTCSKCKAVYHVVNMPPKVEGICDKCGGNLVIREDDRPESIRVRMEAYEKSTSLLVDYYRRKGLLAAIPAQGTPEEVFQRMSAVLKGKA